MRSHLPMSRRDGCSDPMAKRSLIPLQGGRVLITLVTACLICAGCEGLSPAPSVPPSTGEAPPEIQVYFTAPSYPDSASTHQGTLEEPLIDAIDAARSSIDIAMYDFESAAVADAVVRAQQRGIAVRLVTETDYAGELGPERLSSAGIPVVTDGADPYMHNKILIIDGEQVWTGSWNIKESETYRNDNNAIVIHSVELAENYTTEFEEMFVERQFGSTSPDRVPHPRIQLADGVVETIFESEGNARQRIIQLIRDAESSVYVMAFVLTDDGIAGALVDRQRAGVDVAVVIETRNTDATGSDFANLRKAGVDILEDGNPYIMHHKVIVVDKSIVVTGSYNFTSSAANYNDENVLILHSPAVAEQYLEEFDRVYQQALEAQP